MKKKMVATSIILTSTLILFNSCQTNKNTSDNYSQIMNSKKNDKNYVILFVWDGLRPDVLTDSKAKKLIPNLLYISENGVEFKDNHSAYPTFTMNNAQAFATGDYAGKSGFYGNNLYQPWRANKEFGIATNASGNNITSTFLSPIFTEDYKILKALDQPNNVQASLDEPLVQVSTLLQEAQKLGMTTAVIGKSGPAFFQDFRAGGYILDENHVWPLSFAKELQAKNVKLPKLTENAYNKGEFVLALDNGNPTASDPIIRLAESKEISDPSIATNSPFNKKNEYMADVFLNHILPTKLPQLSVVWLRNPDSTQHAYGPGTLPYYDALRSNDLILGSINKKLKEMGIYEKTNIIIVSDHAHSNIVATKRNDSEGFPQLMYPMHDIANGKISNKTSSEKIVHSISNQKMLVTNGYSTSGTIRTADLISKAQLKTQSGNIIAAYDGGGCSFNMPMSGIRNEDGSINTNSPGYNLADGSCIDDSKKNSAYTSPSYLVPNDLTNKNGVDKIVVAANGGSDYIYIPNHDLNIMKSLVNFFQRRQEYSVIFVDENRYPIGENFPRGVLPLSYVKLENKDGRNPDMVISVTSNPNVIVNGLPGTEFDSTDGDTERGDHGTFGRTDVHNTLLALGPDFNSQMKNNLPTGNVDVAPTIANILGFKLHNTDGRVLYEAIKNSGYSQDSYKIEPITVTSSSSCELEIYEPTTHPINFNLNSKNRFIDPELTSYYSQLNSKMLISKEGVKHVYFDFAEAKRQKDCPNVGMTLFHSNNN
ncbi:phosphodiesterase [Silvanigrella paludirubra]|uniref:Phosphodiesterase n=1 Tax=Silvanigrella paludirubra TaxID=2499159 RepID=A0A6N6VSS9_9BACT|nr:alkaline phosphatase family protein [Silvanigrella paludirubra]KAB8039040.1 phosphodiesterase [Silvanigrella paludirubra]